MSNFKIPLYLFFTLTLFNFSPAIRQSYTLNGKRCISDCMSYTYYFYCYYNFYQWDYCEPNKTGQDVQYFTAIVKENSPNCSSQCDYFEYDYQWCFVGAKTSVGWNWDYCSSLPRYSSYGNLCITDCVKGDSGSYGCIVRGANGLDRKYEVCAPDPLIISNLPKGEAEIDVEMILIDDNGVQVDYRYKTKD